MLNRKKYLVRFFSKSSSINIKLSDKMSKKFSKEPLRGMDDFYPADLREVNWIIETIRDVVERYSYEEYATPQIEPVQIFAAKSSDELVNEQSYIVEKKKGERLKLIPELTPSLARMVAKKSQ